MDGGRPKEELVNRSVVIRTKGRILELEAASEEELWLFLRGVEVIVQKEGLPVLVPRPIH